MSLGRMKRNPSKHFVSVLDVTKLCDETIAWLKERDAFNLHNVLHLGWTIGLVEKNGKHYCLNTEGVGAFDAIEDSGCNLGWYRDELSDNKHEHTVGVYPIAETDLTCGELMEGSTIVDRIPLDKFVRSFGARLDDNFIEWQRFLDK
jgi:hypothetical protein